MLEALIAAPFVRLGAEPVFTIAVICGALAIAPYLTFALYFRAKGASLAALLFAAMPLLLPVEHGLQITALNGIAVLALVPFILRMHGPALRGALLTLVLALGVFVNPNAVLLALPIGLQYLLEHRQCRHTWWSMFAGASPVLLIFILVRWFFHENSAEVVNTIFDWRMHFKPYMIHDALERLDSHFAWTGPLSGGNASIGVLILVCGCIMLFIQRRTAAAWAGSATIGLIAFSFCFAKVHDGADSIFFPLSRFFIAIPLVLAWVWGQVDVRPRPERTMLTLLFIAALVNSGHRLTQAAPVHSHALEDQEGLPVRTWPVTEIKKRCKVVSDLAFTSEAGHIILLRGDDPFAAQFLAYAIPVFHPEASMTWMVGHDRRAFQRRDRMSMPVGLALIVANDPKDLEQLDNGSLIHTSVPYCMMVHMGGRSIAEVIQGLR